MSVEIPWLIIVIIFIASTIFATFGFGDALLALPFLTIILGLQKATPLLALSGYTLAICLLGMGYKYIRWKEAIKLVAGSLFGVPLGVWLLKHVDKDFMQGAVGIVIILISLYSLFKPSLVAIKTDKSAPLFGFVGGILGGAFNTSAPPAVMFGAMRGWSPEKFVGMMQAYFIMTDLFVIFGHLGSGLLTKEILIYYLWCFPFLILAVYLGNLFKKKIPVDRFKDGVFVLILLSGLMLLVRSLGVV